MTRLSLPVRKRGRELRREQLFRGLRLAVRRVVRPLAERPARGQRRAFIEAAERGEKLELGVFAGPGRS
jgi:hypothetical protein